MISAGPNAMGSPRFARSRASVQPVMRRYHPASATNDASEVKTASISTTPSLSEATSSTFRDISTILADASLFQTVASAHRLQSSASLRSRAS